MKGIITLTLTLCSTFTLLTHAAYSQGSEHSLAFNGSSDHIEITDSPELSFGDGTSDRAFSLECWVKPVGNGDAILISKEVTSSALNPNDREWLLGAQGSWGVLHFAIYDNHGGQRIARNAPITNLTAGEWHHVAATYDGSGTSSGMAIYVNGIREDNVDFNVGPYTAMHNTGQPIRIGTADRGQSFHDGSIDEVRIWDKALTVDEIRENMCQKLDGNEPNLVAYYRMDEGVDNSCSGGEDVCDLTGNGNHGTKF